MIEFCSKLKCAINELLKFYVQTGYLLCEIVLNNV